jgi:uncharacterized protein (TIGR03000 family)
MKRRWFAFVMAALAVSLLVAENARAQVFSRGGRAMGGYTGGRYNSRWYPYTSYGYYPYGYRPFYSYGYAPTFGYYGSDRYAYYSSLGYGNEYLYTGDNSYDTPADYSTGTYYTWPVYYSPVYFSAVYYSPVAYGSSNVTTPNTPTYTNTFSMETTYPSGTNSGGVAAASYYPPTNAGKKAAVIEVKVPATAEVLFDGERTTQPGQFRVFRSPPLEPGQDFTYEVTARWREKGELVERTQKARIRAGERAQIDFMNPEK